MWALLLAACLAVADPNPAPAAVIKVRPATAGARLLLDDAARSSIISGLIAGLEQTNQIVYVQFTGSPDIPLARTKLVTANEHTRFLRIDISLRVPVWERLPLLAHELQHALEIGRDPDVRTDNDLRRLYERIGTPSGPDKFETLAAREVERRVRGEMGRKR
jgi:hypothetical protein